MEELLPNYTIERIQMNTKSFFYHITNTDGVVFTIESDIDEYISKMKLLHDNFQIIVEFLKLNGFIKHSSYYYLCQGGIDICVHIYLTKCVIRRAHGEFHCNVDEFYKKMREILNIETMNKHVQIE